MTGWGAHVYYGHACSAPSAIMASHLQPVREVVSYRRLFTADWFGVREKHCFRLEIYDRLRASEHVVSPVSLSCSFRLLGMFVSELKFIVFFSHIKTVLTDLSTGFNTSRTTPLFKQPQTHTREYQETRGPVHMPLKPACSASFSSGTIFFSRNISYETVFFI